MALTILPNLHHILRLYLKKIFSVPLIFLASAAFANPEIIAHRGGTADAPEK
jgi:hypothetical protein